MKANTIIVNLKDGTVSGLPEGYNALIYNDYIPDATFLAEGSVKELKSVIRENHNKISALIAERLIAAYPLRRAEIINQLSNNEITVEKLSDMDNELHARIWTAVCASGVTFQGNVKRGNTESLVAKFNAHKSAKWPEIWPPEPSPDTETTAETQEDGKEA